MGCLLGHEKGPRIVRGPGYVSGMPGIFVVMGLAGVVLVFGGAVLSAIGAARPRTTPIPGSEKGERVAVQRDGYALWGAAWSIVGAALSLIAYVAAML